jgi:hypothetical protein
MKNDGLGDKAKPETASNKLFFLPLVLEATKNPFLLAFAILCKVTTNLSMYFIDLFFVLTSNFFFHLASQFVKVLRSSESQVTLSMADLLKCQSIVIKLPLITEVGAGELLESAGVCTASQQRFRPFHFRCHRGRSPLLL